MLFTLESGTRPQNKQKKKGVVVELKLLIFKIICVWCITIVPILCVKTHFKSYTCVAFWLTLPVAYACL